MRRIRLTLLLYAFYIFLIIARRRAEGVFYVMEKDKKITQIAVDSIGEYISAAEILFNRKKNGMPDDAYGMATLLLLVCALDGIGSFYDNKAGQFMELKQNLCGIKNGNHIKVLAQASNLVNNDWVSNFDINYRNKSVHNATLLAGYLIDTECGEEVIEIRDNDKYLHLGTMLKKTRELFDNFMSVNGLSICTTTNVGVNRSVTGTTSD